MMPPPSRSMTSSIAAITSAGVEAPPASRKISTIAFGSARRYGTFVSLVSCDAGVHHLVLLLSVSKNSMKSSLSTFTCPVYHCHAFTCGKQMGVGSFVARRSPTKPSTFPW